jgi:hypothetical protein
MEKPDLIAMWNSGLRIRHMAHSIAFTHFKRLDKVTGVVAAVLSAVVGTTVFASLAKADNKALLVVTGSISVMSTVVISANSFLKFGELAERHNQAAASFGNLRRQLEVDLINNKDPNSLPKERLQELNDAWSELEKTSPAIPQRIYNHSEKSVGAKQYG